VENPRLTRRFQTSFLQDFFSGTDGSPDVSEGRLADKRVKLTTYQKQFVRGAFAKGIEAGCLSIGRGNAWKTYFVRHTSNDPVFLSQNADGYAGAELYIGSASAISENRVITAPGTAPASFTAAIFESVGLDHEKVVQFKAMMAAEHV
jgi:hypothetical protein